MKCSEIIKKYLGENGFDGLVGDGCGCELSDLFPCDNPGLMDCVPAMRHDVCEDDGCEICGKSFGVTFVMVPANQKEKHR